MARIHQSRNYTKEEYKQAEMEREDVHVQRDNCE